MPRPDRARLVVLAIAWIASFAASAEPVEGKDYLAIKPAQATSDPSKIVVTEFFSYQCPHCFAFARPFADWSGTVAKDVKVELVAVSIGHKTWVPMAQAYYALLAMKKVPGLDDALFKAIHKERAGLVDEPGIAGWVARQGIDRSRRERTATQPKTQASNPIKRNAS